MTMYAYPVGARRSMFDEVGIDIKWVTGPDYDTYDWPDVLLYYAALQFSFYTTGGANQGGGHVGLQVYDNQLLLPNKMTVVNWGCYDATVSGTFRQSEVIEPDLFIDINNNVSMGMDWSYGEWIRFRVFKSPKQDWTAAHIKPGDNQVPPYVDTDQQADEVAYRCSIENLTRGTPPVDFHDVLIKSPADSKPIGVDSFWQESLQKAYWEGDIDVDWPSAPDIQFRNLNLDGYRQWTGVEVAYYPGDPGGTPNGPALNCDVTTVTGPPGYVRMQGGVTRTNANGAQLTLPTGFWDAAQANVTPAITDNSTRIPTRRPWF